jgi:putative sigma-54 modulation protein
MRITIRNANALSPSLADLARHRLEFALGRFGARVRSLTVRLLDLNGPKGGVDKQCLVEVVLNPSSRLVLIEDTDADAAVAISRAADRAGRAVARAVHAMRDSRADAHA